jgi:hypothetical protein
MPLRLLKKLHIGFPLESPRLLHSQHPIRFQTSPYPHGRRKYVGFTTRCRKESFLRKRKTPIFVVGCSRSGTTVLQACLAASDEVFAFPETQLPFSFFTDAESLMFDREATKKSTLKAVKDKALQTAEDLGACRSNYPLQINKSEVTYWNSEPTKIPRIPLMRRAFDEYRTAVETATANKFWVEKSPRNIFILDKIEKYIPDALFLHIVRRGEDTIASLLDAGRKYPAFAGRFGGERGLERACDYWNKAVTMTERYATSSRHHISLYNELIKDPEKEIEEICRFAGLRYSEAMAQPNFSAVREPKETWKFTYGNTLANATPKYERLSVAEQETISLKVKFSEADLANISQLSKR